MKEKNFWIEKIFDDLFELKHYYDDPGWLLDKEDMQDLAKQIKELGF